LLEQFEIDGFELCRQPRLPFEIEFVPEGKHMFLTGVSQTSYEFFVSYHCFSPMRCYRPENHPWTNP
jgi:hypothetical protein